MLRALEIHRAGAPVYALEALDGEVHCGCGDGTVLTWSMTDPMRISLTAQLSAPVFSARRTVEGLLAIGTFTGELCIIDLRDRIALQRIEAHAGAIHDIGRIGADLIATAGADGHLRTWRREGPRWRAERDIPLSEGKLRGLAASSDGGRIAVACGDGPIRVLESGMLNEISTFTGHEGGTTSLAFHPTKPVLLSGGKDGALRVWPDQGGAAELISLPAHRGAIYGIAFNNVGTRFVTASRDKTVKLWDAATLEVIIRLEARDGGHAHSVNAVAWLGDSLISAGDDRRLIRWIQNG